MDKRTLIAGAAERSELTREQVEQALDAILATVEATLAAGDYVALAGFGRFEMQPYPARRLRRFDGQGHYEAEARSIPVFKSSSALRRRLREGGASHE